MIKEANMLSNAMQFAFRNYKTVGRVGGGAIGAAVGGAAGSVLDDGNSNTGKTLGAIGGAVGGALMGPRGIAAARAMRGTRMGVAPAANKATATAAHSGAGGPQFEPGEAATDVVTKTRAAKRKKLVASNSPAPNALSEIMIPGVRGLL